MKYNELGNTGMKVSALSFGASSLGGVFHDIKEAKAIEAVHVAIDNGMNFIDVSPYYGHYMAETVLGKALREIDRSKYYLSTKVGRYGNQVVTETLPALVELRDKGVVSHVGITDLQLENLKWVIEHAEPGQVETVLTFCHYALNDDKLLDYLDFFESNGIGVINASPLSMGLLSQRGVPSWHPAPAPLVEACKKAAEYCTAKGYPIEKLAMQFSVSNPRIATTLFSSANPDNVALNIRYIEDEFDSQLADEVREIIGDQKRVSWANS